MQMRQRQLHSGICSDGKELPSNVSNFVQNEWQETKEFQAESWAKTKEQNAENWKKIKSFFAKLSESN